MLLKKLIVQHYGPFASNTEITFENDVTVITGPNDAGKTSILNLIEVLSGMRGGKRRLSEEEVNLDRIGSSNGSWENDTEITCEVFFSRTDFSRHHLTESSLEFSEMKFTCRMAPKSRHISDPKWREAEGRGWSSGGSVKLSSFPRTVRLPLSEGLTNEINLVTPSNSELQFLEMAFGSPYNWEKYSSLTENHFLSHVKKAEHKASTQLKKLLPASMGMSFGFQPRGEKHERLAIHLMDQFNSLTPLNLRGSGIQKLTSMLGTLMTNLTDDQHYLILLDEPETSLHADIQHKLRHILEQIASKPNLQVIYATHSPSMISPSRTNSLRLVTRNINNNTVSSKVNDRPVDENFSLVRSTLGINPTDSLLYAPITLIVEGPSEVLGLPIILRRLEKSNHEGFDDVSALIDQVHWMDGCGDSFEVLCGFAKSQGSQPILFLDGDKATSRKNKVKKRFPDVPIIELEQHTAIEDLVERIHYFNSLSSVMQEFDERASDVLKLEDYEEWIRSKGLSEKMAFARKIDRWVEDRIQTHVEKPLVVKHFMANAPIDGFIQISPLKKLMEVLRSTFNNS